MPRVDLHGAAPHEHRGLVAVGQRLRLDDALHVGTVAVAGGYDDSGGVLNALADSNLERERRDRERERERYTKQAGRTVAQTTTLDGQ